MNQSIGKSSTIEANKKLSMNVKDSNFKYYINLIIGLSFIFLFKYIPSPPPMTQLGMQVLGIFIGTIYMIATIHPAIPAFIAIAVLITTPLYNFKSAFATSFGHWVPIFVMSCLLLSYALTESGIAKRITIWFLTRKVAKKGPWVFLLLFFGSLFVLGFFMDILTVMAFYLSSIELICKELGYEKKSRLATSLVLGVAFMVCIMGASTGFQPHVAIVLGLFNKITGNTIGMFQYTVWSFPILLSLLLAYLLMVKVIIRPDFSKFQNFNPDTLKKELGPMKKEEIYTGIIYMMVVIGWFLPGFTKVIGIENKLIATLGSYGVVWPAFIGIILLSLVRVEGKALLDLKEASRKGVPWHIVFLIIGNMILASALTSPETGFTDWFTMVLEPLTKGASIFELFIFGAIFTVILTNLGSNSVAGIVAFQLVALLIPNKEVLLLVALGVAFATRICTVLPSSFVGMGMAYGNEWVDTKKILPLGILFAIVGAVILILIGYPLANIVFS